MGYNVFTFIIGGKAGESVKKTGFVTHSRSKKKCQLTFVLIAAKFMMGDRKNCPSRGFVLL